MDTPTAETDPLVAALDALQVLTGWDDHPADRVLEAAQAAPAQLHQALTWGGQWSVLSPLDRADLYALWAAGEYLALCGVTALEKGGAAGIEPISRQCAYFAAIVCPSGGWPVDPDRERLVRRAAAHHAAYQKLTAPWQAHVITQLTPAAATSDRLLRALSAHVPGPPPHADARLDAILTEAARQATRRAEPPQQSTRLGHDLRTRLAALPTEWRQQIMRRLGAGTTPLDAIAAATRARTLASQPTSATPDQGPRDA